MSDAVLLLTLNRYIKLLNHLFVEREVERKKERIHSLVTHNNQVKENKIRHLTKIK